jgi:hypothetical protein
MYATIAAGPCPVNASSRGNSERKPGRSSDELRTEASRSRRSRTGSRAAHRVLALDRGRADRRARRVPHRSR